MAKAKGQKDLPMAEAKSPPKTSSQKRMLQKSTSHFVSKLKKGSNNNFPVHIIYGHTLHEPVKAPFIDILQPFPGTLTHCLPCDQQKYHYFDRLKDPATQLVRDKDKYLTRVHTMQQTHGKRNRRRRLDGLEPNIRTALVAEFAELLETDPDKYFEGNYDWYYSGGNVETVQYEDESYVLKVGGQRNDLLSAIPFDVTAMRDVVLSNNFVELQLEPEQPIYEVTCSNTQSNVLIAARQKNRLSLLTLQNTDTDFQLKTLACFKSQVPFISSTFDGDTLVTLDVMGTIHSRDIATGATKEKVKLERTPNVDDRWAAIRNYGRHTHLVGDRCGIKLIDTRQAANPVMTLDWRDSLELNETLSCVAKSEFENVFYVGSTYKLFAIDIRRVNDDFRTTKFMRWTHNLAISPAILKTVMKEDERREWLVCGSNLCGDLKVMINERHATTFQSPYPPFKPTNIRDSYLLARRNGKCLPPASHIHGRIDFCTTGLAFHQTEDELLLFTQNSAGDLFHQRHVPPNEAVKEFKISVKMQSWMKSLEKFNQSSFHVTDMVDLSDLCEGVFRSDRLREVCAATEVPATEAEPPQKWQQSVETMQTYCDALAKDMLAIWEVNDMVERQPQVTDKVSDWFARSENIAAESTRIEEQMGEPSFVEPSVLRRRSKANRSKHVQGF